MIRELNILDKFTLISCEAQEFGSVSSLGNRSKIVFVMEGSGVTTSGDEFYEYEKNSFFLLHPDKALNFKMTSRTTLFAIAFGNYTSRSRQQRTINTGFSSLFRQVEQIFSNKRFRQGSIMERETDRQSVCQLVLQMGFEMTQLPINKAIIKNCVFLFIEMVLRNQSYPPKIAQDNAYHPETDRIIDYIKRHIQQNRKITIQQVSEQFDIPEKVINESLIRRGGLTFKQIVLKHKTDIFKSRLLNIGLEELASV